MTKENITRIVSNDLCVSCGACYKACNVGAISIYLEKGLFIPSVDDEKCTLCGLCLKTCPSNEIDVKKTYGELDFYRNDFECYIAYTKNEILHHKSASGGIVSSIVFDLLKNGIYEKAYTLEYESFRGERAKLYATKDPTDVYKTVKSKYIPASIEEVIEDIKNHRISKSIIVGTPCQFLAIKKYLSLTRTTADDVLLIGLFCDKTLNYNIYRYYELKYGQYDCMHFRDKDANGWPGDTVLSKNKRTVVIDKQVRMSLKPFFQLNRCRFCFDKLNQLADISCGDCYISGQEDREGRSSLVIRTEKGRKAFDQCKDNLEWKASSFEEIKKSQYLNDKLENMFRNTSEYGAFTNIADCHNNQICTIKSSEIRAKEQLNIGKKISSYKDVADIDKMIKKENKVCRKNRLKRVFSRIKKAFFNSDTRVRILIDNAGFENKGAELMLVSVVHQIKQRKPDAQIVVPKNVFYENPSFCIAHHIIPMQKKCGKIKHMCLTWIYYDLLNKPWYVTPQDIDMVLDAGGFQFSDQWKSTDMTVLAKDKYYASFSKKKCKIIFLPQAFGPFEEEYSRLLMKTIYKYADYIYAREIASQTYLNDLFPGSAKIKLAPDFTCLCLPQEDGNIVLPKGYITIIPNSKMITHTDQSVAQGYLPFLKEIISYIIAQGEKVVLVNHEGHDDEKLILSLENMFKGQVIRISGCGAIEVKRIIRDSKLLISSRFHGVVSGLSQRVPTLCTSWSHKYEELLKEYNCSDNILDIQNIEKAKQLIDDTLSSPQKYVSNVSYGALASSLWDSILGQTTD